MTAAAAERRRHASTSSGRASTTASRPPRTTRRLRSSRPRAAMSGVEPRRFATGGGSDGNVISRSRASRRSSSSSGMTSVHGTDEELEVAELERLADLIEAVVRQGGGVSADAARLGHGHRGRRGSAQVQRVIVDLDEDGAESAPVVVYPALCGRCGAGDRVLLNTTAVDLGLGTGGEHFCVARGGGAASRSTALGRAHHEAALHAAAARRPGGRGIGRVRTTRCAKRERSAACRSCAAGCTARCRLVAAAVKERDRRAAGRLRHDRRRRAADRGLPASFPRPSRRA